MVEKQNKEQAQYRAEVEKSMIMELEYLRTEGERIRVEREVKEDERIRQMAEREQEL